MVRVWEEQAAEALTHAIGSKWKQATDQVGDMIEEHGVGIITQVMLCWIDATLVMGGVEIGQSDRVVVPLFVDATTGQVTEVDKTPPAVRWAGRLLVSRATGDLDTALGLVRSISTYDELTDNLIGVLTVCSVTLRCAAGLEV